MKFEHNPAHLIGTCQRCGEEMVFNVPRLGANGGYVHKSNGKFDCNNKTPMTPPNESALTAVREIEPCPFCGNKIVRLEYNTNAKWCICNHCHAQGPVAGEEDDAIKYWNDTKHSAAQQQEIERLTELCVKQMDLLTGAAKPHVELVEERDTLAARLAEMEKALRDLKLKITHPTIHVDYYNWLELAKEDSFWKPLCDFKTFHAIAMWVWSESRRELEQQLLTSTPSKSEQKEKANQEDWPYHKTIATVLPSGAIVQAECQHQYVEGSNICTICGD